MSALQQKATTANVRLMANFTFVRNNTNTDKSLTLDLEIHPQELFKLLTDKLNYQMKALHMVRP